MKLLKVLDCQQYGINLNSQKVYEENISILSDLSISSVHFLVCVCVNYALLLSSNPAFRINYQKSLVILL